MIPSRFSIRIGCDCCREGAITLLITSEAANGGLDLAIEEGLRDAAWEVLEGFTICPRCVDKVLAQAMRDLVQKLEVRTECTEVSRWSPAPSAVESIPTTWRSSEGGTGGGAAAMSADTSPGPKTRRRGRSGVGIGSRGGTDRIFTPALFEKTHNLLPEVPAVAPVQDSVV